MLPSGTEPLARPELLDDADLLVGDGAQGQPAQEEGQEENQADSGDDPEEQDFGRGGHGRMHLRAIGGRETGGDDGAHANPAQNAHPGRIAAMASPGGCAGERDWSLYK